LLRRMVSSSQLLTSYTHIGKVQPKFGLLVCDEAHRLKNLVGKTSVMLNDIRIDRRILLTGTPIQNNLMEFHAMLELVAPGILGTQQVFKRCFEDPIIKSRIPNCTKKALERGQKANFALQEISSGILLRRTADILDKFLPPKYEEVVFCSPSALQVRIYQRILGSERVKDVVTGSTSPANIALNIIGLLRKLCNSPELLIKNLKDERGSDATSTQMILQGVDKLLPPQITNSVEMSGE
jgi:DNA repair and recombination protein RAD54B